ncbi:MAG: type IV secretion system DNA-binding domain-containing protein, partial [Patescibacteria group bacterium]
MPPTGNGLPGQRNKTDERRITYFATTHTRGKREMFGIRAADRGKHMYVIGKTGMGKSTMLENMAIQDIQNGEGIAYIDPHGATAERLLNFVPHERIKDVVYLAPFDTDHPIGFNVMEDVGYDQRHLVVSGLMGAFKRIWVDAWSARMEYILQNTLLALLEYPDSTLLDVNRMLVNKTFRAAVIEKITDPIVKEFWTVEFTTYTDRYTQEATPAIQNKVGQFVSNPLIRNIVGQPKSSFDLRKMMDGKKIFIVNLSKGRMGESNAALLGSMLTVKIYLAAMSRASEPPARMNVLPPCYFYVDEFQSMMNEAFADILSESRKYKLALTLANQYIEQMEENVRDAVFGNVGTLICFRVGPFDAEVLKTVFEPTFMAEDLVGLGLGQIYLTLMIDGVGSAPFSAETIPPIEAPPVSYREDVIQHTRATYACSRTEIERMILQRQNEFLPPLKQPKERREHGGGQGGGNRAERSRPAESTPRPAPAQEAPAQRPAPQADQRSALRDAILSV